MLNTKLLAALCYFSVFFSPLLLPVIIYLVTDDRDVKHHAKRSFISHLIPVALLIVGFIIFSFSMLSFDQHLMDMATGRFNLWGFIPFLFTLLYSALFLAIVIWNIIQGGRVLR